MKNQRWMLPMLLILLCLTQGAFTAYGQEKAMTPKIYTSQPGEFNSAGPIELLVGKALMQSPAAYQPLVSWLKDSNGLNLGAVELSNELPSTPSIVVGLVHDSHALQQVYKDSEAQLPAGGLGSEGYILEVTSKRITLVAEKPAGIFYGALELLELNSAASPGLNIQAGTSIDWPTMHWRGLHVSISSREDLPAVENLITTMMPRYRLNQLILQVDYHYQFKTHPEMAESDGLTFQDCQHLTQLARENFIRITPMIDCLGHQSWAGHTGKLLREHPEFDETPNYPADNKGIYCRSWCPSNPAVYKVVDDLIGELVDAFDANSFNVGMDEVFILGECPLCKGTPNDVLFARAVNHLHDYIVGKRKLQMMMWGDRLLDGNKTGYGEWEASTNGTAPAINLIPKDIILCDWHYEEEYDGKPATYPSVSDFENEGFRVWPAGWNSKRAVKLLTGVSLATHSKLMMGYLASTWIGVQSVDAGLKGEASAVNDTGTMAVVNALIEGAEIAWQGSSKDSVKL